MEAAVYVSILAINLQPQLAKETGFSNDAATVLEKMLCYLVF